MLFLLRYTAMMSTVEEANHGLRPTDEYQHLFETLLENIKKLPPNELSYYLALFVAAIHNEPNREGYSLLLARLMEESC